MCSTIVTRQLPSSFVRLSPVASTTAAVCFSGPRNSLPTGYSEFWMQLHVLSPVILVSMIVANITPWNTIYTDFTWQTASTFGLLLRCHHHHIFVYSVVVDVSLCTELIQDTVSNYAPLPLTNHRAYCRLSSLMRAPVDDRAEFVDVPLKVIVWVSEIFR